MQRSHVLREGLAAHVDDACAVHVEVGVGAVHRDVVLLQKRLAAGQAVGNARTQDAQRQIKERALRRLRDDANINILTKYLG